MGIFKTLIQTTLVGGAATTGAFFVGVRNSKFVPLSASDPVWSSVAFNKFNPEKNPTTNDLCVRKVPLNKLKPHLLEKEGRLVEGFCAGVWGGLGYAFQRAYLERKYRGPETESQLWAREQLLASKYEVGTLITDHFEVIEHTPEQITVRCGDSPRKRDVRPSDGLFEIGAVIKKDEGVAEFKLKSVFYQGLGKAENEPMPPHIVWLHQQYTKLLMETAIRNVML